MSKHTLKSLLYAALIAAVYVASTLAVAPIAFGSIQFRISEALTLLPALTPAAIPGLGLGCLLANFLGGNLGWIDVVFGTSATVLAAYLVYLLRHQRPFLLILPPILVNALVVGSYLPFLLMDPTVSTPMSLLVPMSILTLGLSEAVVVIVLGLPLYFALRKTPFFSS